MATKPTTQAYFLSTSVVLDKASGVSCVPVSTPSYMFLLIQLLGHVQQTRYHVPEPVISFGEEIRFEAQFDPSWSAADVKTFLRNERLIIELCQVYQNADNPTTGTRVTIGVFSAPAWRFLFSSDDIRTPDAHRTETVTLEPVPGSLPFPPVQLSFALGTVCVYRLTHRSRPASASGTDGAAAPAAARTAEAASSRRRPGSSSIHTDSRLLSSGLGTSGPLDTLASSLGLPARARGAGTGRSARVVSLARRSPPVVVSSARVVNRPLPKDDALRAATAPPPETSAADVAGYDGDAAAASAASAGRPSERAASGSAHATRLPDMNASGSAASENAYRPSESGASSSVAGSRSALFDQVPAAAAAGGASTGASAVPLSRSQPPEPMAAGPRHHHLSEHAAPPLAPLPIPIPAPLQLPSQSLPSQPPPPPPLLVPSASSGEVSGSVRARPASVEAAVAAASMAAAVTAAASDPQAGSFGMRAVTMPRPAPPTLSLPKPRSVDLLATRVHSISAAVDQALHRRFLPVAAEVAPRDERASRLLNDVYPPPPPPDFPELQKPATGGAPAHAVAAAATADPVASTIAHIYTQRQQVIDYSAQVQARLEAGRRQLEERLQVYHAVLPAGLQPQPPQPQPSQPQPSHGQPAHSAADDRTSVLVSSSDERSFSHSLPGAERPASSQGPRERSAGSMASGAAAGVSSAAVGAVMPGSQPQPDSDDEQTAPHDPHADDQLLFAIDRPAPREVFERNLSEAREAIFRHLARAEETTKAAQRAFNAPREKKEVRYPFRTYADFLQNRRAPLPGR